MASSDSLLDSLDFGMTGLPSTSLKLAITERALIENTEDQLFQLQQLGCAAAQGYPFASPLDLLATENFIASYGPSAAFTSSKS